MSGLFKQNLLKLSSKKLTLFKVSLIEPPAVCCVNIRFGHVHKGSDDFKGSFLVTSKTAPLIFLFFKIFINSFSSIKDPLPALINNDSFFSNFNFFLSKKLIVFFVSGDAQTIMSAILILSSIYDNLVLISIISK